MIQDIDGIGRNHYLPPTKVMFSVVSVWVSVHELLVDKTSGELYVL